MTSSPNQMDKPKSIDRSRSNVPGRNTGGNVLTSDIGMVEAGKQSAQDQTAFVPVSSENRRKRDNKAKV